LSEDAIRNEGFAIFKNGLVRRLSPTHYVVRESTDQAWRLVELKHGRWLCDCDSANRDLCVHLYAAQLHRSTAKLMRDDQVDEAHLKCRYCGSLDVARCGFRYNTRGIARRYFCHDCQRKFSIPHVENTLPGKPAELLWLLNEVGMLISRLTDLVYELEGRVSGVNHIDEAGSREVRPSSSVDADPPTAVTR
jgi:hypothetical protein